MEDILGFWRLQVQTISSGREREVFQSSKWLHNSLLCLPLSQCKSPAKASLHYERKWHPLKCRFEPVYADMVLDLMLLSCCLLSQMGRNINFRHQAFQGQWLHFRGQVRKGQTEQDEISPSPFPLIRVATLRITKWHLSLAVTGPSPLPLPYTWLYKGSFSAGRSLAEGTPQSPSLAHLILWTYQLEHKRSSERT